ncbi:hypothetical protein G7046_g8444 [Stylonectria norvegica]|nr:hypothetical protein G7046_g8444 [Stylonectria norvegica]
MSSRVSAPVSKLSRSITSAAASSRSSSLLDTQRNAGAALMPKYDELLRSRRSTTEHTDSSRGLYTTHRPTPQPSLANRPKPLMQTFSSTSTASASFATAVVQGKRDFRAVAVATDISPPASPCGMCRQFIREFCSLDMPIIMFDKNEDFVITTLGKLLPVSFGPDSLPPPKAAQANAEAAAVVTETSEP